MTMIPGSNLLNKAFSLIAKQSVFYFRYIDRVTNVYGIDQASYEPPIVISGSFQPVPRARYAQLGLDFSKYYAYFFCPKAILGVERNVSGDVFQFQDKLFQCESITDWFADDGWVQVLGIMVENGQPTPALIYIVDPQSGAYLVTPGQPNNYVTVPQ